MRLLSLTTILLALKACRSEEPTTGNSWHSAALNLQVTMSSYLGGGTADTANQALTVGMDNSGQVFVGGKGHYDYGLTPVLLDRGGDGFVLVLRDGGRQLHKMYRYGSQVSRIVVREKGDVTRILVQSDKGLVLFNGDLDHVVWNKEIYCPVGLCYSDLGSDGTVAVVIAGENPGDPFTVQSFTPDGTELGSTSETEKVGEVLNDIAVDPLNRQILIASYNEHNYRMVPCILAFDYTLQTENWHAFCVNAEEETATHLTAAIWIHRMHYSDFDNKLYVAANSHGGNMILLLNPTDVRNNGDSLVGVQRDHDAIHQYDHYTQTDSFHGHHVITYVARYNPKDGALEDASFFLPRAHHEADACGGRDTFSWCAGDAVSVDISSGPDGTILVAHNSTEYIEHRSQLTINGQQLAEFHEPSEAVLLGVPPELNRRLIWHHFAASPGASQAMAVAAGDYQGRTHVAFIAASSENTFVTEHPLPHTSRAPSPSMNYVLVILEAPAATSGTQDPPVYVNPLDLCHSGAQVYAAALAGHCMLQLSRAQVYAASLAGQSPARAAAYTWALAESCSIYLGPRIERFNPAGTCRPCSIFSFFL